MAKVFETSLTISGYLQARKLLDEVVKDDSQTSRTAPSGDVKDGDVFVYKVVDGEKSLFWRVDVYRWEHLGAERCPRNKPEMMCYKFKLLSYDEDTKVLEKQEFIRKEYVYAIVPISSASEVVNTGNAFQNEESCELFVLTNEASLNSGRSTAGSQNETLPQYIRTESRIREEMKDAIKRGESPINVYSKTVISAAFRKNINAKTYTPTSKKQVYNISTEIAKSRKQDDLFNLYDLSVHSHGFVHLLDLANGLKVVLGISPLLDHVERLYSVNDFIYFYYDTTYSLGDYFVSILSLEHRHFRSKRDNGYPTIFVAALLHEFTDHSVHKGLFSILKDRIPSFNTEKLVLVMDREAAITKAIRLVNPDVKVFYCWRHLRENVTAKARKFLKNDDELNEAMILLGKLFHTKNMMAYDYERRRLENEWPADADQFSNVQLSDVSSAEDSSSGGSSEEEILGLSTSLFSQDVTLERSFSELPVLTTDHHIENVLNINGIHLCLCDLKSVTVGLPEEQHQVITYFHP
ncbi:unnamed protein product [Allacma fusca]|uniref:MULE transposase domain-containing protein n=1 Tax=Allacma fusca TaxID=39272 RepID=A0A8J2KRD3_9HEXA|nr:unnamed protein product [Allacma fusca]